MNDLLLPLLYSYRRCPYAMRARMALHVAGIEHQRVDLVSLRDKPARMLEASPKGTVPVLCLPDGSVIDESLDIMHWALAQADPEGWLSGSEDPEALDLLRRNDGAFKKALDRYKYASRFPEVDPVQARADAMAALIDPLSACLNKGTFIGGQQPTLQDVAIFPFVRQFAGVAPDWFACCAPANVVVWLSVWTESSLFAAIMSKHPN